jgi:manganese/iron transport system permease protein/iron/zinc/copper transport system permease protein
VYALSLGEPYGFQFFRNGAFVALIAGGLCGLLGVFVVLRGMSYIGHGLSHAVFGGAAASAVMNFNYFIGAGIWGVVSGVLIGRIARRRIIGADAAIGVVTTASFALGLALLNRYGQAKRSIEAVLFGSVLGVKNSDIIAVLVVAVLATVIIVLGYRKFLFSTFAHGSSTYGDVVAHHLGHHACHWNTADFCIAGHTSSHGAATH